jgi:hypothetical protein
LWCYYIRPKSGLSSRNRPWKIQSHQYWRLSQLRQSNVLYSLGSGVSWDEYRWVKRSKWVNLRWACSRVREDWWNSDSYHANCWNYTYQYLWSNYSRSL